MKKPTKEQIMQAFEDCKNGDTSVDYVAVPSDMVFTPEEWSKIKNELGFFPNGEAAGITLYQLNKYA